MLYHFFRKTEESTAHLFENLAISRAGERYTQKQGKYPVIFLTWKGIKGETWEIMQEAFKEVLLGEYSKHHYLLSWEGLQDQELKYFKDIISGEASLLSYALSVERLSEFLHRYHGVRTVVLIDEYDTPINTAYLNGYYDQAKNFVRGLLEAAFKDNNYLEKGVITGIMRIAKEGLFSGLNNPKEFSLLQQKMADKFGFTEEEVSKLLGDFGLNNHLAGVRERYNGYVFGLDQVIYNPWAIIRFADAPKEGFKPYWVNTSHNLLIRKTTFRVPEGVDIRPYFEALIQGEMIRERIQEHIIFPDLKKYKRAVWNLLLFSGYLKAVNRVIQQDECYYDLMIPNREVHYLFRSFIKDWVKLFTTPLFWAYW